MNSLGTKMWVVVLCCLLGDGAMVKWRDVSGGSSAR